MDLATRISCLANIDLFRSFSPSELRRLAENISELKLAEGQVIFQEGTLGQDMFILLKGTLNVYKDNRFITMIEPVDYFGEMAIIENKPRAATIKTITSVHLLQITSDVFQEYLSHQPKSLVSLMKTLSGRIRNDNELIAKEFGNTNILVHDMKNRLAAFLLLDIIAPDIEPEKFNKYLDIMQASRHDLALMMEEALSNAKCLKFVQPKNIKSLSELITELLDSEFFLHQELKDKIIKVDLDKTLPLVPFCKIDIRRVLTNLMINAGQASKPGAEIRITLRRDDDNAIIEIIDHGCGISDDIKNKIFLHHFSTKNEGNGLGLASCKQIIEERHDGTLTFYSIPDQGTTFIVTLPLHIR